MPITISGTGAITGATTSYSFDNNVSIGGTLTYEDFTNVDSVGLITARSGIHVTGGSVGIGTTIPNAPIHVAKDGTGQVLARFESNMGTNNGRSISISSPSTDSASEPFIFGTGNSIQFLIDENINIIDSEGRLGINTTNTESTKLRVYLDASDTSKYFWGGGSRGLQISDSTDTNAGDTTTFHKASASGQYKWTNLTGDRLHLESSGELIIKPDHGNGNNALSLGIERAWYFKQINTGATTMLGMYSTSNKSLEIGGDTNGAPTMTVQTGTTKAVVFHGSISKAGGSFRIPHPLPSKTATNYLVHSFVEAPDASNLYAGMVDLVDGTATVNIDTAHRMTEGTFEALNHLQSWSSSNESGYAPVKCSVSGNILTIECQDTTSTDTVYYEVRGIRKDQHMLDTDWTDENGRVITEPLIADVNADPGDP